MTRSHSTTGVLFLDDLFEHRGATTLRAEDWRPTDDRWLPPSVLPPASLVVVLRSLQMAELGTVVPWLSLAERVALVFHERREPSLANDAELREVARLEREDFAAQLGNVVTMAGTVDALGATIDEAVQAVGSGGPPTPFAGGASRGAASPGPWLRLHGRPWTELHHTKWSLRCLRGALMLGDTIALLDRSAGVLIDLESGATAPMAGLAEETFEIVALPGAQTWLSLAPRKPGEPRYVTAA